jgi:hypothetical protein
MLILRRAKSKGVARCSEREGPSRQAQRAPPTPQGRDDFWKTPSEEGGPTEVLELESLSTEFQGVSTRAMARCFANRDNAVGASGATIWRRLSSKNSRVNFP